MHSDRTCPECKCALLERIGHGWHYCEVCSAEVLYDAEGRIVRIVIHGHEKAIK